MNAWNNPEQSQYLRRFISLCLVIVFVLLFNSCNFVAKNDKDNEDSSLEETRVALSVEQTLATQQSGNANATIAAQQATIQAQVMLATMQAQQPAPQAPAPPIAVTAPPQAPPGSNPPSGNVKQFMQSAQILLFEDIVADPSKTRYFKQTLDSMGLRYKDDGNAIGWLKNDLISGTPDGKTWDLIIMAMEARGDVSGEYFEYLMDVLNKGSSVILESWYLDAVSEGKISPVLTKCGVQVYPYFPRSGDLTDVVLYPLQAASSHPIMNSPNKGLSFTKSQFTWLWSGDLGSLMAMTGKGDPVFLLGRNPKKEGQDAALATCMGGRLILQTFSSHSFSYKNLGPLLENYIYYSLGVRMSGGK